MPKKDNNKLKYRPVPSTLCLYPIKGTPFPFSGSPKNGSSENSKVLEQVNLHE
jgi:hypothetical protein